MVRMYVHTSKWSACTSAYVHTLCIRVFAHVYKFYTMFSRRMYTCMLCTCTLVSCTLGVTTCCMTCMLCTCTLCTCRWSTWCACACCVHVVCMWMPCHVLHVLHVATLSVVSCPANMYTLELVSCTLDVMPLFYVVHMHVAHFAHTLCIRVFAHFASSIQCHFAWVGPVSHMFVVHARCYYMLSDFVYTFWKSFHLHVVYHLCDVMPCACVWVTEWMFHAGCILACCVHALVGHATCVHALGVSRHESCHLCPMPSSMSC